MSLSSWRRRRLAIVVPILHTRRKPPPGCAAAGSMHWRAMARTRWSASGATWPGGVVEPGRAREDGLVDGIIPGAAGLGGIPPRLRPHCRRRGILRRPDVLCPRCGVAILASEQQCRATSKLPNRRRIESPSRLPCTSGRHYRTWLSSPSWTPSSDVARAASRSVVRSRMECSPIAPDTLRCR